MSSRPQLIALGEADSWDDGMVFGTGWVDVGDEWWFYYSGYDGPHGDPASRQPGIGLATVKKERLISLHGPRDGGVVITRQLRWQGERLFLNADASQGEIKVRISDGKRKVLEGFDYEDCVPLHADSLRHEVKWNNKSMTALQGEIIRLEIYLRDADLFTFQAGTETAE
ncbi:hypothetical protein [Gimesia maris]|uniref:hypothetical protein n=1 Tax=Gimesia maris TaxID=122 RepID=UPI0032ECC5BF